MTTKKSGAVSFLKPDDQPELEMQVDTNALQTLEADGDYTAERLFEQRPKVYRLVVALLARGWGSQRIADTARSMGERLSKNTVKAVRAREGGTIDLVKTQLGARSFDLAEQAFEAAQIIVDEVMANPARRSKLTVKDASALAVVGGIAIQNGQLLSGGPTARVEVHEVQKPEHDAFNEYLKGLPSANPPATHLMAETPGQKAAAGDERPGRDARPVLVPAPPQIVDVPTVETDLQSEVSTNNPQ